MPDWWKPLVEFDKALRVGSHVKVRWGYGGGFRAHGSGRVVKVSGKSVQVELAHDVASPGQRDKVGWPKGHVLVGIPRPSFQGLLLGKWNEWNGIMPASAAPRANPILSIISNPSRDSRGVRFVASHYTHEDRSGRPVLAGWGVWDKQDPAGRPGDWIIDDGYGSKAAAALAARELDRRVSRGEDPYKAATAIEPKGSAWRDAGHDRARCLFCVPKARRNPESRTYVVSAKDDEAGRRKSWGPSQRMYVTAEGTVTLDPKRARRFTTLEEARQVQLEHSTANEVSVRRAAAAGRKGTRIYYDIGYLTAPKE